MGAKIGLARLGFGCAAIPGPLTKREALTLLETAHACGIRHFDTARMYGNGKSERVLGELARQRREELYVVTKAGIVPSGRLARGFNKIIGATKLGAPKSGRFEPQQIRHSVETSLRELKLEQVDALLLHEIEAREVRVDLKDSLAALHREGKIAAHGIATSVEQSEAIIANHPDLCGIVQVPATWLDRPRALPDGARLIIHSALGGRLSTLLGRLRADDHLARRFEEETGLTAADPSSIGRLMLQATMLRNNAGTTLFASARIERIRANAELLTAKLETHGAQALDRLLHAPEHVRGEHKAAP